MLNNKPVPITKEVLKRAGCTRPTLIKWCRKYEVDGKPLGFKVGGRWRVYPDRIDVFVSQSGE